MSLKLDRRFLTVVLADGATKSVTLDENGCAELTFPEPTAVLKITVSDRQESIAGRALVDIFIPPPDRPFPSP